MKVWILGLSFFTLAASAAEPTSFCLNKNQAAALADLSHQSFRATPLESGDLKIERPEQGARFWIYHATNQVLPSPQASSLCRERSNEYQKARLSSVIESLRQANPLAIVFFLSLASAGNSDLMCRQLESTRLFRLALSGLEPSPFGEEVYLNERFSQLLDVRRGLVFISESCSSSSLAK